MDDTLLQLVSRAAQPSTSTRNAFIVARNQLFTKLYPAVTKGFEIRIAVFHALNGVAILACLFYLCLLFVRKEQGRRVNWWFCRTVSRPQGRTLIVNIRIVCVLMCLMASVVILAFGVSYARVYIHHQAQSQINQWRSFVWLPLTAQGYFISRCYLQAFLICLQDLQLFSMPKQVIWVFGGITALLSLPAIAISAMMTVHGARLWEGASKLLDLLTELAQVDAVAIEQLVELAAGTAAVEHEKEQYHNLAIAVYSLITAILVVLVAVNAGSWALCQLMQGRISAAQARLASPNDLEVDLQPGRPGGGAGEAELSAGADEVEGGWDGPTPTPTPTSSAFFSLGAGHKVSVSRRELMRMTKVDSDDQGADGTVRERAEAVLAMKKALFDLRVISSVVGLTVVAQLMVFVYIMIFVADNWLLTRPFGYNEAASLGTLWVNLVVVSGGMGSLIYSELRYRSPVGSASDDVGVDELALSPVS